MQVVAGLQLEVAPARVGPEAASALGGRAAGVLALDTVDEGARQSGLAPGQPERLGEGLQWLGIAPRLGPGDDLGRVVGLHRAGWDAPAVALALGALGQLPAPVRPEGVADGLAVGRDRRVEVDEL